MLRYKIFSCTCTDTWCYINRPSLVLAQTLEVMYKIFSCTRTLAQTLGLGATLKDLPSYLHRHLMLRYRVLGYRGGGTADQDHIYQLYAVIFLRQLTFWSLSRMSWDPETWSTLCLGQDIWSVKDLQSSTESSTESSTVSQNEQADWVPTSKPIAPDLECDPLAEFESQIASKTETCMCKQIALHSEWSSIMHLICSGWSTFYYVHVYMP